MGHQPRSEDQGALNPDPAGDAVSGSPSSEASPGSLLLLSNQPNPFNPETVIQYTLPEAGEMSLAVYDVSGSLVKELELGSQTAGLHRISWNGETQDGRPAASGTYLYRLNWQGHTETGRMTLLR
jgi:hypothetical protein